jgi:hypothetical protein
VSLASVESAALTAECEFDAKATEGIELHVRSSHDGLSWDTEDFSTFDLGCLPGETARRTFALKAKPMFLKVLVSNDSAETVRNLRVTATLGA